MGYRVKNVRRIVETKDLYWYREFQRRTCPVFKSLSLFQRLFGEFYQWFSISRNTLNFDLLIFCGTATCTDIFSFEIPLIYAPFLTLCNTLFIHRFTSIIVTYIQNRALIPTLRFAHDRLFTQHHTKSQDQRSQFVLNFILFIY